MTTTEFAAALGQLLSKPHLSAAHIEQWEASVTPPGDVLVAAMAMAPSPSGRLGLRSHKFIAAFTPAGSNQPATQEVGDDSSQATMHSWSHGSIVIHLAEELELPNLANLALWRVESYEENLAWATNLLRSRTGDPEIAASYVLSVYWVHTPIWVGQTLDTALRIMCTPRVLLERDPRADRATTQIHAEQVEHEMLTGGFRGEMKSIGVQGISAGYASWSGVVYHPADPGRALPEDDFIELELELQAAWVFCEHIIRHSAVLADEELDRVKAYRKVLRSMRARLLAPQPQETGQHRSMRDAIVETSGLPAHLEHAAELLKEMN
ncbi:hypothetical protein ACTD5D_41190 [Nocardia takedensis]|uniref:hypothetical protein n=1 Tax=Nocardia takedensis TaxID=259390 RepID=UPI003F75C1EF